MNMVDFLLANKGSGGVLEGREKECPPYFLKVLSNKT